MQLKNKGMHGFSLWFSWWGHFDQNHQKLMEIDKVVFLGGGNNGGHAKFLGGSGIPAVPPPTPTRAEYCSKKKDLIEIKNYNFAKGMQSHVMFKVTQIPFKNFQNLLTQMFG